MVINNENVQKFVDKYKDLFQPNDLVLVDASKAQYKELVSEGLAVGEIEKLNSKLLPGCYYHRTDSSASTCVKDRTFICTQDQETAGITNNWMQTDESYKLLNGIAKNAMKGRTMYVIPFSMGKVGSKFAKYGVEITDSIYVVLNMMIMTRVSTKVFEKITDDTFIKCIHSNVNLDAEKRYLCQFPEDNTIYSLNSGYAGNALLGKKALALRIASYQGWKENWLAEHMAIIGIEKPDGDIKYIAAALPNDCGKTNLAMLTMPKCYADLGYKIWTVSDDIAWLRKCRGSTLYGINPEYGFFDYVSGTNYGSNVKELVKKNTIFTNVAYNAKNKSVWWEGSEEIAPVKGLDWEGNVWYEGKEDENGNVIKGANKSATYTAPIKNCPTLSAEFENKNGVPISAIIFGSKRANVGPLVCESRDWEHGVFMGTAVSKEIMLAKGKTEVINDSMAMQSYCGYNMADYFQHYINVGKKVKNKPLIFSVNFFRTDDNGNYIFPGFGENMRILDWIIRRVDGTVDAVETPLGFMPKAEDINISGIDLTKEQLESILDVDCVAWKAEIKRIVNYYNTFGEKLPKKLAAQLRILKRNIKNA
jgi:phosphoenolpyruvate carboxykinase (GTP)